MAGDGLAAGFFTAGFLAAAAGGHGSAGVSQELLTFWQLPRACSAAHCAGVSLCNPTHSPVGLRPQPHLAGADTAAGSIVGATTGVSSLYGAASGCTAGAKALGLGDLNQSKTAFNIKFSYELFTIATQNWFKKLVNDH